MKKMLFILMALLVATPVMAATITLSGTGGVLTGQVSYSGGGTGAKPDAARPAAFALTLTADSGAKFLTVTPIRNTVSTAAAPGYGIFPGSILIDAGGVVTNVGTPVEPNDLPGAAATGIGTSTVVVALGALYSGDANKPGAAGNLFAFTTDIACSVTVAVESTHRGGVVGEDAQPMTVAWGSGINPIVVTGNVVTPPAAPTGVLAADGGSDTSIAVSWTASSGATSYDVYKGFKSDGSDRAFAGNIAASPYSFVTGTTRVNAHGETTYFWVKAKNASGDSPFSASDAGYSNEFMPNPSNPAAERTAWIAWGRPDCWGFQRQCRGDINGTAVLTKTVTGADLTLFKAGYDKADTVLATVPNGICADLNHANVLTKRVTGADLTIFKAYYDKTTTLTPICAPLAAYNWWKN